MKRLGCLFGGRARATMLVLLAQWLGATICAQPAALDPSFGGTGTVSYSISASVDVTYASVLQPDGAIVVVGYCANSGFKLCVTRLSTNGSPDPGFANSGTYLSSISPGTTSSAAGAVLPDGKLLIGAECELGGQRDFCFTRLNANGTLDTAFGLSGLVTLDFQSGNDSVYSITVLSSGQWIAAGRCNTANGFRFCSARFNANGTVDLSYGPNGNGKLLLSLSATGESRGRAMIPDFDGRLLHVGNCDDSGSTEFCMTRLFANGSTDTSFGVGGVVRTDFSAGADFGIAAVLQADGKIVFAGSCGADICVARYTGFGALDASFGSSGIAYLAQPAGSFARAALVQSDGKILVGGDCPVGGVGNKCLARLHADGTLDLSFSPTGKANYLVIPSGDAISSMLLQPDGKVVLVGQCGALPGPNLDTCLVRIQGGPLAARQCSLDVDGDGRFLATTDGLILNRVALGMSGPSVLAGITLANAPRNTWAAIRNFLVAQCGLSLAP